MYIFTYFYFYFVLSRFSLEHMIGYPQSQLLWKIVDMVTCLTQRKLNTQQIIAYPSEKHDKIPKNKPKKYIYMNIIDSSVISTKSDIQNIADVSTASETKPKL